MVLCVSTGPDYFFCTYLRQSMVTADRIMMPENTNCRFVSTPRIVREYVSAVNTSTPTTMPWILPMPPLKESRR